MLQLTCLAKQLVFCMRARTRARTRTALGLCALCLSMYALGAVDPAIYHTHVPTSTLFINSFEIISI